MPKRRVDSDDEDSVEQIPASKRARTDEHSDNESQARISKKKKKKASDSEPEDDEAEEDEMDPEEAERIRLDLQARQNHVGCVAEHGILEYIEMHNFMCHKFLSFKFGPQTNFIIGHNGSGKSAVLSAITVALGGKSNSTGRGNGLKSFIKEGQSVAEVTVHIKNQGDEAYKPEEYGKTIQVTRKFTLEGSSTWKIKSKDGRIISTKRDDLSAIADHMNIQVDNPMNVLTQDAARQFLSASNPQAKYDFFLKGTQLSQLADEYDLIRENIDSANKVLVQKQEALPDLKEAYKAAKARFQEAEKARKLASDIENLKGELAWAHVAEQTEILKRKAEELVAEEKRVPKAEKHLSKAEEVVSETEEEIRALEQEREELGNIDDLRARAQVLKDRQVDNRTKIAEYLRDEKAIDASVTGIRQQITEFDERIREESARMAGDTQTKRNEAERKLSEAKANVENAQNELTKIIDERQEAKMNITQLEQAGKAEEAKERALETDLNNANNMLRTIDASEGNKYLPYGNNVQGLQRKIQSAKWFGDTPIGPMGLHVKVKDNEKWGDLLRRQLISVLMGYAITDARDRPMLKKMLDDSQSGNSLIVIYEKDEFDYSRGEPPERFLTALRALEFDNKWVLRIFINFAKIERILLAPTRKDGENQLRQLEGGGDAWTADFNRLRRYPEGGESTGPLSGKNPSGNQAFLLLGSDVRSRKEEVNRRIAEIQRRVKEQHDATQELRSEYMKARKSADNITRQEKEAHNELSKYRKLILELQGDMNNDLPANIGGLQAAKEEAQGEMDNLKRQFEVIAAQKARHEADNRMAYEEIKAVRAEIDAFTGRQNASTEKIADVAGRRVQAQSNVSHFKGKLAEAQGTVERCQKDVEESQAIVNDFTRKAANVSPRVENPRSVKEVERSRGALQNALTRKQKEQGATIEELSLDYLNKEKEYRRVIGEFEGLLSLNKVLNKSIMVRLARWQEFRRHIALRCKTIFQFNLSYRGYMGKVLFDHQKSSLVLRVQTDLGRKGDDSGAMEKDPRSLSGGEKSFSTICLLLSLWEAIGCPLRCLDEFDVFMDAINRRIAMKMMLDTANSSDKKQYILITPQDMSNVKLNPQVRVNRMPDPERGQGTLNFT